MPKPVRPCRYFKFLWGCSTCNISKTKFVTESEIGNPDTIWILIGLGQHSVCGIISLDIGKQCFYHISSSKKSFPALHSIRITFILLPGLVALTETAELSEFFKKILSILPALWNVYIFHWGESLQKNLPFIFL